MTVIKSVYGTNASGGHGEEEVQATDRLICSKLPWNRDGMNGSVGKSGIGPGGGSATITPSVSYA